MFFSKIAPLWGYFFWSIMKQKQYGAQYQAQPGGTGRLLQNKRNKFTVHVAAVYGLFGQSWKETA